MQRPMLDVLTAARGVSGSRETCAFARDRGLGSAVPHVQPVTPSASARAPCDSLCGACFGSGG